MQTASSDYFTGLRDALTGLTLDVARSKLIDVETMNDTRDVPDYMDAKARQAAGVSVGGLVLIGAALLVGVIVLKRVL